MDSLIGATIVVSCITRMELLSYPGLTSESEQNIKRFLADVTVIGLNANIEQEAIALKRANRLKLPDSIVVATASVEDAFLVSRDRKLIELSWPGLRQIYPA